MSSRLKIIVTGLIAQHPNLGGVSWDYVQYAAGLKKLGHEVYYFEDSGEWPYKEDGGETGHDWVAKDCKKNILHLTAVMDRFGLKDHWAYRFPTKNEWFGLSGQKRNEVLKTADLLINVSGTLEFPERYRSVPRLAYIDSDPVFTQIKLKTEKDYPDFCKRVHGHDVHFSFGEKIGASEFKTEQNWIPTRTPILLSEWEEAPPPRPVLTTVLSWTSYKPLEWNGKKFGQKDQEFKTYIDLPNHVQGVSLEMAIHKIQHENWETDRDDKASGKKQSVHEELVSRGWKVQDPSEVCSSMDRYRDYIFSSRGEWSVAKGGYVAGSVGWFSCRSACYLAAGRPVIVQNTGFEDVIPVGKGVLSFKDFDGAVRAIDELAKNYRMHTKAARQIAETYFDSNKVLNNLVEKAMNSQVFHAL